MSDLGNDSYINYAAHVSGAAMRGVFMFFQEELVG